MHRLLVALLAAVDAAIAVAVGIAATLAPLTLLWVLGLGASADWSALWPAAVTVWQFGNLVPVLVTLPADYLAATGIDPAAASFTLSLAPLAFAAFTAIFAARSGVRASRADAWLTGVASSTLVFGALASVAAFTAQNLVGDTELWQAILVPTLVFAVPALTAAVVTEWREAGAGGIARVRDRAEAARGGWGEAAGLVARGTAVVVVGLAGLGAAVVAVALLLRAGEIVALFQAGNVDGLGATVITLAQLAYLPTLVIWGLAFAAGPGFAAGVGASVSPSGTQVGVVPGIPVLGVIPDSTSPWLLLLALVPVALGAFAGWIARSRLVGHAPMAGRDEPVAVRLTIVAGIAVVSGLGAALLAALASGALGPGRLVEFGPAPGPVGLAVGLEVLVGAAILLLSPRGASDETAVAADEPERNATDPDAAAPPVDDGPDDENPTLDLGPRRAAPDAPVD